MGKGDGEVSGLLF